MAAVILAVVILVAALVMLSGVWVATVLIAAVTRVKPPVPWNRDRTMEDPRS
jgi:hypothetical protein